MWVRILLPAPPFSGSCPRGTPGSTTRVFPGCAFPGFVYSLRMNMKIVKLDRAIRDGDWHDKPLRWQVSGPGSEVQNFSTKKDALLFKSLRRRSAGQQDAIRNFIEA